MTEHDQGWPLDSFDALAPLVELVTHFEGFHSRAYKCPAGVWTIGYGSTRWGDGSAVKRNEQITEVQAQGLMRERLRECLAAVDRMVKVRLAAHERDALASMAFNIGEGALSRSTLVRVLNEGDRLAVPSEMLRWNKAGGARLAGLLRRRMAEALMWLGHDWQVMR